MDPLVDFMPSQDEFKIIVNNIQNSVHRKRVSHPVNGHTEKLYPGILSYDYYKLEEKNNKKLFNLRKYVNDKLIRLNVKVDHVNYDTFKEKSRFFSYRRSQKLQEKDYGRCISIISLKRK